MEANEQSTTQFISREEAEEFLLRNGADPEEIVEILGENDDFELIIHQASESNRFSLSSVTSYLTDEVYTALTDTIGNAWARRYAFLDWLGEHSWDVSVKNGTIDLGNNRIFPIQVLGTESYVTDSWLWAWANVKSGAPSTSLQLAHELREYGLENRMFELAKSQFSLSRISGEEIALLASSLAPGNYPFACPYENGCLHVLLEGVDLEFLRCNGPRVLTVVKSIVGSKSVDHYRAVAEFLRQQSFASTESEVGEVFTSPTGCAVEMRRGAEGKVSYGFTIPESSL